MKIAITSGYYLFLHPGHLESFRLSKNHADQLWVIVNNDQQLFAKKGVMPAQSAEDRLIIVSAIRYVDKAVLSVDTDATVCQTLEDLIIQASGSGAEVIFTKGGDRFSHNTPEKKLCDKYGVKLVDGLGNKTHSSSEYIKRVRE